MILLIAIAYDPRTSRHRDPRVDEELALLDALSAPAPQSPSKGPSTGKTLDPLDDGLAGCPRVRTCRVDARGPNGASTVTKSHRGTEITFVEIHRMFHRRRSESTLHFPQIRKYGQRLRLEL